MEDKMNYLIKRPFKFIKCPLDKKLVNSKKEISRRTIDSTISSLD
jgi:hypothetical protein